MTDCREDQVPELTAADITTLRTLSAQWDGKYFITVVPDGWHALCLATQEIVQADTGYELEIAIADYESQLELSR